MAGAIKAQGTKRAEVGWVRFSVQCFLPESLAWLSRPERCVVVTLSGTFVSAPLVAGGFVVPPAEFPGLNRKYRSAIQLSVCDYPFKSFRSRQY
jgi:hypothetical protein